MKTNKQNLDDTSWWRLQCSRYLRKIRHAAAQFCLTPAESFLGILSHLFLQETHSLQAAFVEDVNARQILFHERHSPHSLLTRQFHGRWRKPLGAALLELLVCEVWCCGGFLKGGKYIEFHSQPARACSGFADLCRAAVLPNAIISWWRSTERLCRAEWELQLRPGEVSTARGWVACLEPEVPEGASLIQMLSCPLPSLSHQDRWQFKKEDWIVLPCHTLHTLFLGPSEKREAGVGQNRRRVGSTAVCAAKVVGLHGGKHLEGRTA